MFSRIHARLGTAGFVVAGVALIAALAGSAFAAATLTGPEKKQVTKIATQVAKKYAGATGPAGPVGPAGKDGTNGTNGKDGATGSQGPTGKTGATGEAGEDGFCSVKVPECVLPPGATVTGDWSFLVPQGGAANNGAEVFVTVSYPLQVNLDFSANVEWVATGSSYDPSACPGSVSEPKAAPGHLCFYSSKLVNAGTEPCSSNWEAYTGDLNSGKTIVFCIEEASSEAYGFGSWAASSK